jgi:exosortase F-associated protein
MENGARFEKRVIFGLVALAGISLMYMFQYTDVLLMVTSTQFRAEYHFIVNRLVRILVNDTCMLLGIYALFWDKNVLKLALFVEAIDLLVLFPLYLVGKLSLEGVSEISSPFLSQFHRLIVNPTLMILLIPAIYYQKTKRVAR